jgi:hypothetical protein
VLALVADAILAGEPLHELDGLAQPRKAHLERRPLHTRRGHVVEGFAGTDTEHDASRKQLSQGADGLRDDGRMVAKRRCHDAGADDGARGAFSESPQPGKRVGRVPAGMPPGLEMIAHHDRVETDGFRVHCELEQLAWMKLLGRSFVSQFQHGGSFLWIDSRLT